MKCDKKIIHVADVGSQSVDLHLLTIKNGVGPKTLIVSGVHGNEFSGFFVLEQLLKHSGDFKGELNILAITNPLATLLKQRENPIDNKDLNRMFPGDTGGTLSQRLAWKIFEISKSMDLVVDLHTFSDPCPIVAIYMDVGTDCTKQSTLNAINTFDPEVVWRLSFTKTEAELSNALGPKLALAGVTNFAIEMPEHFRITQKQISKVTEGILRLLGQQFTKTDRPLNIVTKHDSVANNSGLFISNKKIFDEVLKGDIVGKIVSLKDFSETVVTTLFSGTIVVLKERDVVNVGDTLFSIGIKD